MPFPSQTLPGPLATSLSYLSWEVGQYLTSTEGKPHRER